MNRSIKLAMQSFAVATVVVMGLGVWALSSTPAHAGKRMCVIGGPSGCPPHMPGPTGTICDAVGCDPAAEGACLYLCPPPPPLEW